MSKELEKLKQAILSTKPEKVGIVMHNNPDPDSMGAGLGLSKLITTWNPETNCILFYDGEISHAQNRTMVNVLGIQMVKQSEVENFAEAANVFITVDVTPDRFLEKGIDCLMTIDHHRVDTSISKIKDIRPVGATSSIVWEYLKKEEIELDKSNEDEAVIATALLIGIKTDTSDLVSENVTDLDFEAYKNLIGCVNRRHLSAIINYPIPPYHFEIRSQLDQEENVKVDNGVFVGGIGYITPAKRDALATMAEERARVEGIETAFVFAVVGDNIEVSVRSVGLSVDVNALCQKIFGKQYAGGKMGAGAAKIPMGFLTIDTSMDEDIKDKTWASVKTLMIHKIFHVMSGNA